jgi:hypothetical protein
MEDSSQGRKNCLSSAAPEHFFQIPTGCITKVSVSFLRLKTFFKGRSCTCLTGTLPLGPLHQLLDLTILRVITPYPRLYSKQFTHSLVPSSSKMHIN